MIPTFLKKPVLCVDDSVWTPYQQRPLPGSPILPSFGLEQYGLPIPRKNAEAWRQFDLAGLVTTDYSGNPTSIGEDLVQKKDKLRRMKKY